MMSGRPEWLKVRVGAHKNADEVDRLLETLDLNTVCHEANCPNRFECYGRKTATFMILGRVCTRDCSFCNVAKGPPEAVDSEEPVKIRMAVERLNLTHAVVTSVTRDDLPDGGASHFARVIAEIKKLSGVTTEALIPDFAGDSDALRVLARAKPDVIGHNIETIPRLYPKVRPKAIYSRSVEVLREVKSMNPGIRTKSGLMLGLGETRVEVLDCLRHLRAISCDFLTLGQYLPPSKNHYPAVEYICPEEFESYRKEALAMGFLHVVSKPLARSSYMAEEALNGLKRIIK